MGPRLVLRVVKTGFPAVVKTPLREAGGSVSPRRCAVGRGQGPHLGVRPVCGGASWVAPAAPGPRRGHEAAVAGWPMASRARFRRAKCSKAF